MLQIKKTKKFDLTGPCGHMIHSIFTREMSNVAQLLNGSPRLYLHRLRFLSKVLLSRNSARGCFRDKIKMMDCTHLVGFKVDVAKILVDG